MLASNNQLDDDFPGIYSQTKSLPEGYSWFSWGDGSGELRHPDGTSSYGYDRTTYHNEGGIEYQEPGSCNWSIFWGSFEAFQMFAEQATLARIKS